MSKERYQEDKVKYNASPSIEKILDSKKLNGILHYTTSTIKMPSYEDRQYIKTVSAVWKRGDKLYKYAEQYYRSPESWWIIALYNNKPTEAHFNIGDIFYIPTDLNNLFDYVSFS